MPSRVVIVGAGPAALATARSYRDHGGAGQVTIVGEEHLLPYERPPLTKHLLQGKVDAEDMLLEPPAWFADHDVEVSLGFAAVAIDPSAGTVTLSDGRELPADAIVLATGSEPARPELPGAEGALTIRRMQDCLALRERAAGRSVVVVGGGFIASEAAASLAMLGGEATVVDRDALPQAGRIGDEAASRLAGWLDELGVRRVTSVVVEALEPTRVKLDGGRTLDGACVLLATGVEPRSELAGGVGLPLADGRVPVDSTMRVAGTDGRLLAVGDVALADHGVAHRSLPVEHWGDALEHGACAGRALAGAPGPWHAVPGFWSTIGERTIKFAGWGDGFDDLRFVAHDDDAFTVWYVRDSRTVGVLTHERDEDYERGREAVAAGARAPL